MSDKLKGSDNTKVLDFKSMLRPRHRHLAVTGPYENVDKVASRLEDEGFTVVSVSGMMVPMGPQQLVQFACIYAIIPRGAPETKYEKEIREASNRMIKPVGGGLL